MPKRKITAEAVVFDAKGRVLLVRQGAKGRNPHEWELPGGHVKKGESPAEAIEREVREETALRVAAVGMSGVFYIPDRSGRETYDFVFLCRLKRGTRRAGERGDKPRPRPPEIEACAFWPADALPESVRPFTKQRIEEALKEPKGGNGCAMPVKLKPSQWLA